MPLSNDASLEMIEAAARRIQPLHRKKAKPGFGDWLGVHREPGQTFEEYRASNPNRPDARRKTLYIQPLGSFTNTQNRLVRETADFMERFYGPTTKVLDRLGLEIIPPAARRAHPQWGDRQILSTYVLDQVLRRRRPEDAVAVLALTTSDLWPGEGWNFVFGQASLQERVGVWSLYRYGDPETDEQQFRRRMLKVAVHETGHMLGMWHCTLYECGMNGSNHLEEMDRRPLSFCPECVQKVWWACRTDPVKRYRSLVEFAEKHKLGGEAHFWKASLSRLVG